MRGGEKKVERKGENQNVLFTPIYMYIYMVYQFEFLHKFTQVHNLLIAFLDVTSFLSIAFRFFLVLYAESFVKKGTLEVKLLKQI